MKIKHKLWLEKNDRVIFGPGRFELLEAIEECQSLSAAAKKLKMSYRAAWGRLRASEDRLGIPLVELTDNRQGMHLTAEAKKLKNAFVELEIRIDGLLKEYQAKKKDARRENAGYFFPGRQNVDLQGHRELLF